MGSSSDLQFFKGKRDQLASQSWEDKCNIVKRSISEVIAAKNLSFLLGAGCSSYSTKKSKMPGAPEEWIEYGIPTMAGLAKEFIEISCTKSADGVYLEPEWAAKLCIKPQNEPYSKNLEQLMETLLSARNYFKSANEEENLEAANAGVEAIQSFVLTKVNASNIYSADSPVISLYKQFYRSFSFRDNSLSRPWVFTTNYDLYSEFAMDQQSIPYSNGFSGSVDRRFNPANFNYALTENIDISSNKWSTVDGFVYLCKLHGSINWTESNNGLFPIREVAVGAISEKEPLIIYPSPAKQGSSLSMPYSDLFREFQKQVVQKQSALITMGFGFGDEHINNIIYQALTIPTFRLVIFNSPDLNDQTKMLSALNDPRIWFICGEGEDAEKPKNERNAPAAHYFKNIVENFLPFDDKNEPEEAIEKVIRQIEQSRTNSEKSETSDAP